MNRNSSAKQPKADAVKGVFLRLWERICSATHAASEAYRSHRKAPVVLLLLCAAAVFVLMLILNIKTPLIADDFTYSFVYNEDRSLQNLGDVFASQYNHYFLWGGRAVVHALGQIFLLLGKSVFNVVNSLGFVLLSLLIYLHINCFQKTRVSLFVGINLLLWIFAPAFGESTLWVIGSANYLWGMLLVLAFLLPFRLYAVRQNVMQNHMVFHVIWMFLAGVLAGWTNENTGAGLLAILVLMMAYFWINKLRIPKWSVSGLLGALVGYAAMILAPGNYVRATYFENKDSLLTTLINRAVRHTKSMYEYFFVLLLIFAVCLLLVYCQKRSDRARAIGSSLIYFTGFLASVYSMILSPAGFPMRAWFGPLVFLILALGPLAVHLEQTSSLVRPVSALLLCVFLPLFAVSFRGAYRDINRTYEEWQDRIAVIEQEKANGNREVRLSPIAAKSKYNAMYGLTDVKDNPKYWVNRDIARYYGLDAVYKK